MPLSQKGAGYDYRDKIKDQFVKGSLDHLASQIQAVATQGNFSQHGKPKAPSPPTSLQVGANNGLFAVTIVHPNAPPGTRWHIQYSTTPNFTSPVTIDIGESNNFELYRPNSTIYFRAAAKYLASDRSPWTYFGSAASPTPA